MTPDDGKSPLLEVARRYVAAGLSVIPIRADGSKAPAVAKWAEYAERFPDDHELSHWFAPERAVGIGVVCGKVSGNLAVLDFESHDIWTRWLDVIIGTPWQRKVSLSPWVQTPGGGMHVYCRIAEGWAAGGVLARRANKGVWGEIRGQGNYVVAPGSPAACHKTNRPYTLQQEGWLRCG